MRQAGKCSLSTVNIENGSGQHLTRIKAAMRLQPVLQGGVEWSANFNEGARSCGNCF